MSLWSNIGSSRRFLALSFLAQLPYDRITNMGMVRFRSQIPVYDQLLIIPLKPMVRMTQSSGHNRATTLAPQHKSRVCNLALGQRRSLILHLKVPYCRTT